MKQRGFKVRGKIFASNGCVAWQVKSKRNIDLHTEKSHEKLDFSVLNDDSVPFEKLSKLRSMKCDRCEGTGFRETCKECGGTGSVIYANKVNSYRNTCKSCHGISTPAEFAKTRVACNVCGGEGVLGAQRFMVGGTKVECSSKVAGVLRKLRVREAKLNPDDGWLYFKLKDGGIGLAVCNKSWRSE